MKQQDKQYMLFRFLQFGHICCAVSMRLLQKLIKKINDKKQEKRAKQNEEKLSLWKTFIV